MVILRICHFGSGAEAGRRCFRGVCFFSDSDPSSQFIISSAEDLPPLFIRKNENAKLTAMTVAYKWVVDAV